MTRIDEIPELWCRMWSEDSDLAYELMTPDALQWSGSTPGLDAVIGAAAAAEFMTAYRARRGLVFRPRLLVCDESAALLAYTWDATTPDGTIITGADSNVLVDGLVSENWTVPLTGRDDRDDTVGSGSASDDELVALCHAAAAARNAVVHRTPVVDVDRQTAAYLWAPVEEGPGGLDFVVVTNGEIVRTFSFPAVRAFAY